MCNYALFFLDNPTAPQAATTATAPNNTTIECSPSEEMLPKQMCSYPQQTQPVIMN